MKIKKIKKYAVIDLNLTDCLVTLEFSILDELVNTQGRRMKG